MNNSSEITCGHTLNLCLADSVQIFGRYEFVSLMPWAAFPCIIILAIASVVGTFGNLLILVAIATDKRLHSVEAILIVNITLSDLFLTSVADPISIVAKLEGEHFFDSVPSLCPAIASLCTISCVASLMTISVISLNRCIYICKRDIHGKIFTKRSCLLMCVFAYLIGIFLVSLNFVGIGDHQFDRRSLDCTLDRMETYPYTVVFSVVMVWIPCILTGICYLLIYLRVKRHVQIMNAYQLSEFSATRVTPSNSVKTGGHAYRLAKTLFFVYVVFV